MTLRKLSVPMETAHAHAPATIYDDGFFSKTDKQTLDDIWSKIPTIEADIVSLGTDKQDTLISGTNIKTVNSNSLLGSGDIAVQPTLVSGTNIKTVNSTSLLGSGNIAVQASLVSGTNIKTINSASLLGSGDLTVQATLVSGTSIKTVNSVSLLGSGDVAVQPTLVSGTNIKTVNSASLLGSGDIAVQPTLVSATNIKTINGSSILGSGDLVVTGASDPNKLDLTGGTMSGTIVSTPIGIIEGKYLGVTRGFLASDANGIGFLDTSAGWASRVPFGTNNWYTVGATDSLYVRIRSTDDASLTSGTHAFQIGANNSSNLIMDQNEIMARNNGAGANLYLNGDGGLVSIAENLSYGTTTNPTVYGNPIVAKGGSSLSGGYYTKFYDGTMIMHFVVSATVASQTANASSGGYTPASANTLNFPVAFANTNYTAIISGGTGSIGGYVSSKAVGSLNYFFRTITSVASASRTVEIIIMGRWY